MDQGEVEGQVDEVKRLRSLLQEVRDRLVCDVVTSEEFGPYGRYSVYAFDCDSSYRNLLDLVETGISDDSPEER